MTMRNDPSDLHSTPHGHPLSPRYLIIGNGRVARHFSHYFTLEKLNHRSWSRTSGPQRKTANETHPESHPKTQALSQEQSQEQSQGQSQPQTHPETLQSLILDCTHVLLLISDSAIESFYLEHPILQTKVVAHFSGSLASPWIPGCHPLMTFADEFYALETYRHIPFVVDQGFRFESLLPGFSNSSFALAPERKALYHALCVLSGNCTTLLWEKVARDFKEQLGLPKAVLLPYLEQTMRNLLDAPAGRSVLTGPLVRGDQTVLDRHLHALEDDPFRDVYQSFTRAYRASANKQDPLNKGKQR